MFVFFGSSNFYITALLKLIKADDKKYSFVNDGTKRVLQIHNINNRDEGMYSCKVQDKETTAKLYVARE